MLAPVSDKLSISSSVMSAYLGSPVALSCCIISVALRLDSLASIPASPKAENKPAPYVFAFNALVLILPIMSLVLFTCAALDPSLVFLKLFTTFLQALTFPIPILRYVAPTAFDAPATYPLAIAPAKNPIPCNPWSDQKLEVPKDWAKPISLSACV